MFINQELMHIFFKKTQVYKLFQIADIRSWGAPSPDASTEIEHSGATSADYIGIKHCKGKK